MEKGPVGQDIVVRDPQAGTFIFNFFPVGLATNRQQGKQLGLSNGDPKRGLLGSEEGS